MLIGLPGGQRVEYTASIVSKLAKEIHWHIIFKAEIIMARMTFYADVILLKFSLGLKSLSCLVVCLVVSVQSDTQFWQRCSLPFSLIAMYTVYSVHMYTVYTYFNSYVHSHCTLHTL